ncbi:hypothetical protein, partial [Chromobacterium piscinae]|uniref:hypothetical protein n=1 Tax=Chromobacterium piscinae TaxID=686831 RepID=UPI0032602C33
MALPVGFLAALVRAAGLAIGLISSDVGFGAASLAVFPGVLAAGEGFVVAGLLAGVVLRAAGLTVLADGLAADAGFAGAALLVAVFAETVLPETGLATGSETAGAASIGIG